MTIKRRDFLRTAGGAAAGLWFTGAMGEAAAQGAAFTGYGPLIPDVTGVIDLPLGFSYRVLAVKGQMMTDGVRRPGLADGMAAFPGPGGTTVLCLNHEENELEGTEYPALKPDDTYDPKRAGGTSALILDREQRPIAQYVTSAGQARPCAGGPTPWGTWLMCEEVGHTDAGHGYVFEVDPLRSVSRRLPTLGRFSHEAVAYDPATGILYLTEDEGDSLFYRFRPASGKTGQFEDGVLEFLTLREATNTFPERRPFEVAWVAVPSVDPTPDQDSLRKQGQAKGGLRFARGEGAWWGAGAVYFTATSGGAAGLGQVWRLTPGTEGAADKLELFAESRRKEELERPDNILWAPSGDLYICEDGPGVNKLVGYTQEGRYFDFALNRLSESEVAGACFSADGRTLYLNSQAESVTLAINGPFRASTENSRRRRTPVPAPHLLPRTSESYRFAAAKKGYGELEAAALHWFGVPLG